MKNHFDLEKLLEAIMLLIAFVIIVNTLLMQFTYG